MRNAIIIIITILIVVIVGISFVSFMMGRTSPPDGGVFKSTNGGESWEQKVKISEKKNISRVNILSLTIDPEDKNVLYLGTRENGLYKSYDSGEIWEKVIDEEENLGARANIYDIAIDSEKPEIIYLAVYQNKFGRIFKSQDKGKTFREVYITSLEERAIFSIEIDPSETHTVYAGTAEGLFLQSTDYGESWKALKRFSDAVDGVVINPRDAREIYVTTSAGSLFRTKDRGENWDDLSRNIAIVVAGSPGMVWGGLGGRIKTISLEMDPFDSNILYLGSEYGLLKTGDAGENWQVVNLIIPRESLPVKAIAIDFANSNVIYVGAGSQIYKSVDTGEHWTVKKIGGKRSVNLIVLDPEETDIVYVGMHK